MSITQRSEVRQDCYVVLARTRTPEEVSYDAMMYDCNTRDNT